MADTNTYDLFQKVEKWTTKEKFNAIDNLCDIETGTEYNLTGAIDETDLGSDLLAKINGKLTAPTTPTAESAVTMLADGTVGTKPLSEISGKLYLHHVQISIPSIIAVAMSTIYINIYSNNSTEYTKNTIPKTAYSATILSQNGNGTIYLALSSTNAYATGAICNTDGNVVAFNSSNTGDSTWNVLDDMVTEL